MVSGWLRGGAESKLKMTFVFAQFNVALELSAHFPCFLRHSYSEFNEPNNATRARFVIINRDIKSSSLMADGKSTSVRMNISGNKSYLR